MTGIPPPYQKVPHLVWVYPGPLALILDAATWLNPTRELRRMGWKVSLFSAGPADLESIRGIDVICIPFPQVYFFWHVVFHFRLLRILWKMWPTIDFILFNQMSLPWIYPLKIRRWFCGSLRPMLVMDTRTLPMEDKNKATLKDRLRGFFSLLMNRVANSEVDGQTVITQRMAEALHIPDKLLWGVWPSGVDVQSFSIAEQRRCWPKDQEPVQLIYIGTLNYERNLMAFCQVVEIANSKGMKFRFSLVGDGTARADLERFALTTSGRISVSRPVPYDQVPSVLGLAHVGVLPFPDEEKYRVCSPIKLFEYMAAGMPILATRVVCHTDILSEKHCVFWAQAASSEALLAALSDIWQSRFSLDLMGNEARCAVGNWTWEESAKKLEAALLHGFQLKGLQSGRSAPLSV